MKRTSKQPLEIAKTGVERAIEEDEERTIDWMNQQLEAAIALQPSPFNLRTQNVAFRSRNFALRA